ncbi:hypothetical protein RhiirC2_770790 [Rhizophagus irregularis]|uniref:Uncharacterized protein n=1 Tax=Rhizophagus irregularis TaxID=588596 RepID=A0A2N1NVI1_9GLOM|nr:hypothetical protein RhiirC2_770790 [Rhizophagus irregularis]
MYNLHINLPPPLTKKQRRALRIKNERIKNLRIQNEEAILQGTSFNRINKRIHMKFTLTRICESFHEEMLDYTKQYLAADDEQSKIQIYKDMRETMDTSDDAKEIEMRPKK